MTNQVLKQTSDRFLGLDFGEKTIGVAVSDPLNLTAQGLEIIRRPDEQSIKKSVKRLEEIIKEYSINIIVLGYPKNMDNTEGVRCQKTMEFKERLHRNFKRVEVVLWDERLSTVAAHRELFDAGMENRKRMQIIDKMAAVHILQGYLDYLWNNKK